VDSAPMETRAKVPYHGDDEQLIGKLIQEGSVPLGPQHRSFDISLTTSGADLNKTQEGRALGGPRSVASLTAQRTCQQKSASRPGHSDIKRAQFAPSICLVLSAKI